MVSKTASLKTNFIPGRQLPASDIPRVSSRPHCSPSSSSSARAILNISIRHSSATRSRASSLSARSFFATPSGCSGRQRGSIGGAAGSLFRDRKKLFKNSRQTQPETIGKNLIEQRFIFKRGFTRWLMHFLIMWGCVLSALITFPLVVRLGAFQARRRSGYRAYVFGFRCT